MQGAAGLVAITPEDFLHTLYNLRRSSFSLLLGKNAIWSPCAQMTLLARSLGVGGKSHDGRMRTHSPFPPWRVRLFFASSKANEIWHVRTVSNMYRVLNNLNGQHFSLCCQELEFWSKSWNFGGEKDTYVAGHIDYLGSDCDSGNGVDLLIE